MGRTDLGSGDTGSFPAVSADQLRLGGTVLAGLAGAGIGVTGGIAWRELRSGDIELAVVISCFTLLLATMMLFLVLQARVIAQLLERRSDTRDVGAIERRLLAVEFELAARSDEDHPGQTSEDVPAH